MTTCTQRSLAAVLATAGLITLTACGSSSSSASSSTTAATGTSTTAATPTVPAGTCIDTAPATAAKPATYAAAPAIAINPAKTYTATLATSCGTIVMHLLPKQAPVTVNSFVFLAEHGFYNGLTFHRVIPGFVIQGGDPKGDGTGGPGYQFKDEPPTTAYTLGDAAMAKTRLPNTNGSQFFIVQGPNGVALPRLYSRFGHVTSGQNVVNLIANVPADATSGKPTQPVWIYSVTITTS
jgi:cyclophilin family peptidyl-prolyl cis-trans isomerase